MDSVINNDELGLDRMKRKVSPYLSEPNSVSSVLGLRSVVQVGTLLQRHFARRDKRTSVSIFHTNYTMPNLPLLYTETPDIRKASRPRTL